MSGYESLVTSKLSEFARQITRLERVIEAEEESHKTNISFCDDKNYVWVSSELSKIPERRERDTSDLQRKADTFRRKKEIEIEAIQEAIRINEELISKKIEAIETKYETQVKDYNSTLGEIRERLSMPTGKVYLKNKELLKIYKEDRDRLMVDSTEIIDRENAKKKAAANAFIAAEKAEADRVAERGRLAALELQEKTKLAIIQAKEARWKAMETQPAPPPIWED